MPNLNTEKLLLAEAHSPCHPRPTIAILYLTAGKRPVLEAGESVASEKHDEGK